MRDSSTPARFAFRSSLVRNSPIVPPSRCVRRHGRGSGWRRYSSCMAALLDRTCLTASGPDAALLLQSLLSNDVDAAPPGGGVYALLLTPKARVIADIELFNTGDGY